MEEPLSDDDLKLYEHIAQLDGDDADREWTNKAARRMLATIRQDRARIAELEDAIKDSEDNAEGKAGRYLKRIADLERQLEVTRRSEQAQSEYKSKAQAELYDCAKELVEANGRIAELEERLRMREAALDYSLKMATAQKQQLAKAEAGAARDRRLWEWATAWIQSVVNSCAETGVEVKLPLGWDEMLALAGAKEGE